MKYYRFDAVQGVAYTFDYDDSQPRDEAGRFVETEGGDDESTGDPSGIDESGDYTEDLDRVYWRLQDEGFNLSSGHKSESWGDDSGHVEKGTSVAPKLKGLKQAQANIRTNTVEVIGMLADENGTGSDREPVVTPTKELIRFRQTFSDRTGYVKALTGVNKLEDFEKNGWERVPTKQVT